MVHKIYFDLDGVLADFDGFVKHQLGMEYSSQQKCWIPSDDEMWKRAKDVPHFYDQLPLMDGAKDLFDAVYGAYGSQCEILTGIPKPKRGLLTASEDKTNWVRRLLSPDIVVNVVYKEQKPQFCTGKDCFLIDDTERNVREWEMSGGSGILHVSPENTVRILKELQILK